MSGDLEFVARRLQSASSVVYLCGAGLSVASGIRAYRSGPNAVWASFVTDWGTRARFLEDPRAWWETFWLKAHAELAAADSLEPNAGHRALVELCRLRPDDLVVTQNIDGLHRKAGQPEGQLIEIHGRHDRFICSADSGCEGIDHPEPSADLSGLAQGRVPACARCGAPLRPLVLLFDEYYDFHPDLQARRARKALNAASVLVFVGTSFSVGITEYALRCANVSGALSVSVNLEPAPSPRMVSLRGPAEVVLPALVEATRELGR